MSDAERRPCPVCGEQILATAKVCRFCGEKFAPRPSETEGDATGGVIPYKNPPALIAYYCGVFSIAACIPIPFILLPLPICALVFGIKGLKKAKAEPRVRGQVHAWIGIIGGAIFTVLGLVMSVVGIFAIIAAINQKR
ncbi:MAG: hypothetical protein ACM3U2_24405 [Deltaproteobacteria bacterium]